MLLFQPELPKQKDKQKRKQIGPNEKLIIPPLQVAVLYVYNFFFNHARAISSKLLFAAVWRSVIWSGMNPTLLLWECIQSFCLGPH